MWFRFMVLVGWTSLGLLAAPITAHACSCSSPSPSREFDRAVAIFQGPVTAVSRPIGDDHEADSYVQVRFAVRQSWKGVDGLSMTVFSPSRSPMCGYEFQIGKEYLVWAHDLGHPLPFAVPGFCGETHSVTDSTHGLMAFFNSTPSAAPLLLALGLAGWGGTGMLMVELWMIDRRQEGRTSWLRRSSVALVAASVTGAAFSFLSMYGDYVEWTTHSGSITPTWTAARILLLPVLPCVALIVAEWLSVRRRVWALVPLLPLALGSGLALYQLGI
jgi:hypothetical protein